MSTYSTNLALELIGNGEQAGNWGQTTNTNLGTLVEQAISGYTTQAMADADQTLAMTQGASATARNMTIELTGALTAARVLNVPANKKLYFIFNNTTGGFAVTVKVTGQTGVSVPNGAKLILTSNGTDIVNATSYGTSSSTGTVTSVAMTVPTFLSVSGSPITTTGTLAISLSGSALPVANGGTGATSAASAVSNLGALPAASPSYTGTLTGGTGVINIGSGQLGKDAAGNLLVGTTSATNNANTFTVASAKSALILGSSVSADSNALLDLLKFGATASSSQVYVSFAYNSGANGNGLITGSGAGQAQFTANSDIRLKENIVDLPSQLANIMALRPVEFDYKAEKAHQIGFIAQEVREIYPDLIGETKDGYLTLSGLDKNASRLVKAIQDLKALVDAQAVRIAALEAK